MRSQLIFLLSCLLSVCAVAQRSYIARSDLAVSRDGRYVYSAGHAGYLHEIDAREGKLRRSIKLRAPGRYYGVGLRADGRYAAVGTQQGRVLVIDLEQGQQVRSFPVTEAEIYKVKIVADVLILGTRSGPLLEINLLSGAVIRSYDKNDASNEGLNVSSDGRFLLAGNHDGSIQYFDRQENRKHWERSNPYANKTNGCHDLISADISPDGRLGAVTGCGGRAILIDLQHGSILRAIPAFDNFATEVAFSSDNQRLAVSGLNGHIRIFDVKSGEQLDAYPAIKSNGLQFFLIYALGGKRLLSTGPYYPLRIFDTHAGRLVRQYPKRSDP